MESYQMFCMRSVGLGVIESCCALLTFLKGLGYPAHPNLIHDHRFPLLRSGCILSYFQDGKLGLVQNECCHYTTEYCKKRRSLCLIDWGWRKRNVYSSMASPSLSKVVHLTTFLKECFQQSASLWMMFSYCSQEFKKPTFSSFPFFFIMLTFIFHLMLTFILGFLFDL